MSKTLERRIERLEREKTGDAGIVVLLDEEPAETYPEGTLVVALRSEDMGEEE